MGTNTYEFFWAFRAVLSHERVGVLLSIFFIFLSAPASQETKKQKRISAQHLTQHAVNLVYKNKFG
jgi:hypothetical protein